MSRNTNDGKTGYYEDHSADDDISSALASDKPVNSELEVEVIVEDFLIITPYIM